ncbi:hypothetical protein C2E23DRAFT_47314 [Lenzites betulinus]|nr:hypothetical protein C2E23DRAFT_47314 [Lenzites betulinus]
MSSSASIPPAALIQFYQDARSGNNCGMAVTAMFLYDYILCLGREYQYIWQSRKSKASWILYLFIRYTFLFGWPGASLSRQLFLSLALLLSLHFEHMFFQAKTSCWAQ